MLMRNIKLGNWSTGRNMIDFPKRISTQSKPIKTGIVMMNMGGPEHIDQVADYLLAIMTDRDMIQLPFQRFLGPYIAKRRTSSVKKKYEEIGGGSPILKWTNIQGELMCRKLDNISPSTAPHKHYVAFRYVNPLTEHALSKIEEDKPERAVLFSQYPQYSCATSGSSYNAIYSHYLNRELPQTTKWSVIDRWSTNPFLYKTFADKIKQQLQNFPDSVRSQVVVIFSAHSLPLKAVQRGDSYPSEVAATVHGVMDELGYSNPHLLAWQSKVGPLEWLGPSTDEAITGFVNRGKKYFILVPIAFVNEHIETLHEMDIEYCNDLAKKLGLEKGNIKRAAAPNDDPIFIDALADVVSRHLRTKRYITPKFLLRCPHCNNEKCQKTKDWFYNLCNK